MFNREMTHSLYFRRLRALLSEPEIPSQTQIANELMTDQPFVSRAMSGDLKRITKRVVMLRRYAIMRIRNDRSMPSVGKAAPLLSQAAMNACLQYLDEGLDARVLVDQIGLLRRAQRTSSSWPGRG